MRHTVYISPKHHKRDQVVAWKDETHVHIENLPTHGVQKIQDAIHDAAGELDELIYSFYECDELTVRHTEDMDLAFAVRMVVPVLERWCGTNTVGRRYPHLDELPVLSYEG